MAGTSSHGCAGLDDPLAPNLTRSSEGDPVPWSSFTSSIRSAAIICPSSRFDASRDPRYPRELHVGIERWRVRVAHFRPRDGIDDTGHDLSIASTSRFHSRNAFISEPRNPLFLDVSFRWSTTPDGPPVSRRSRLYRSLSPFDSLHGPRQSCCSISVTGDTSGDWIAGTAGLARWLTGNYSGVIAQPTLVLLYSAP